MNPEDLINDKGKRAAAEKLVKENRIYFFTKRRHPLFPDIWEPNPPQTKLLAAWKDPKFKVFTYTGANRIGKTSIGAIIALCTAFGEWPWSGEKIPFTHNEPRKIRYVGQAWESHVKAVVEPALKFWWPSSRPIEKRKNNQGVDYLWIDKRTKSNIEVMSNVQSSDVFEGWSGDVVIYDEPPKRDVRVACARGLIDRQGRELFCMTLLKEAWVHREVIKATTEDGEPDLSVFNINADIYSNVGYGLTQEGISQFSKTLTEEEREARLKGKPSYMTTLVCPRFDRQTHVKERFKIPLDWLVDIEIDFHPSKPWAITFTATGPLFKFVCEEIKDRGNPKFIAEEILRRVKDNHYRVHRIEIDPLAKGDGNNDETVFEIMQRVFMSYGYVLHTASKDKENGIAILNNLLQTENGMPGLFFFKDCRNSIQQLEDWLYDAETLKPSKDDDDFPETLYRMALVNTQYVELDDREDDGRRESVRRNRTTGY